MKKMHICVSCASWRNNILKCNATSRPDSLNFRAKLQSSARLKHCHFTLKMLARVFLMGKVDWSSRYLWKIKIEKYTAYPSTYILVKQRNKSREFRLGHFLYHHFSGRKVGGLLWNSLVVKPAVKFNVTSIPIFSTSSTSMAFRIVDNEVNWLTDLIIAISNYPYY